MLPILVTILLPNNIHNMISLGPLSKHNMPLVTDVSKKYRLMRWCYISYKQVKKTYSLPCAYAVFCGRFIITVNWDYLYAPKPGKLASLCLQRFSSIFETSVRVHTRKIIFLFLNQNICFGCSKEPSRWDGSFEHPKHMLKIIGKKIFTTFTLKNFVYLNQWYIGTDKQNFSA